MEKRIDAAIDIARAGRETLRWIILSALWHGRPYGVTEQVLLMTARDIPLRVTADQVRAEVVALEKRGLVTVGRDGPIWWAELTAKGEDVVDYRAVAPEGIARPPRWRYSPPQQGYPSDRFDLLLSGGSAAAQMHTCAHIPCDELRRMESGHVAWNVILCRI